MRGLQGEADGSSWDNQDLSAANARLPTLSLSPRHWFDANEAGKEQGWRTSCDVSGHILAEALSSWKGTRWVEAVRRHWPHRDPRVYPHLGKKLGGS